MPFINTGLWKFFHFLQLKLNGPEACMSKGAKEDLSPYRNDQDKGILISLIIPGYTTL